VRPVEATEEVLLIGAGAVVLALSAVRVVGAGHMVVEGGGTESRRLGDDAVLACPVVVQGEKV